MKVLHVINSTDIGGAEKILFNLVKSQSNKEVIIISLTKEGFIGRELIKKGYKVHYLNFQKNISVISKWIKFIFLIKKYNPEIVHSWLYHSNLIGGLSSKLMSENERFFKTTLFSIVILDKILTFLLFLKTKVTIESSKLYFLVISSKLYFSIVS